MAPVISGPRWNVRVTCDASPSNARSESAIAVNPLDPYNMVGSSKRFTDPTTYAFSLGVYATFDGGQVWVESAPLQLQAGWAGLSDPAVAWDDIGNAYIIGLVFGPGTPTDYTGAFLGMAAYKSSDGGRTWSAPLLIHSGQDDKQWTAGDTNPASPNHGNVYAAWDDLSTGGLGFARTTTHGASWKGIKINGIDQPAGTNIPGVTSFSPEISIAADGTVYIVFLSTEAGQQAVKFIKSTDGGDSFSAPQVIAQGTTPIPGQLPGGTFRTVTIPTGCTGSGSVLVCAWPDYRDGVARVYYCYSNNGGQKWHPGGSGQPLLTGTLVSAADQHEIFPQLIGTPNGEIGCTFYLFGPKNGGTASLIDVILAVSTDGGKTFANRATVTEQPWDPAVDAPYAHGMSNVTFIGDYFGLAGSQLGFFPFWTDTRTGVQEIYTARLAVNPADVYIRDSSTDTGTVPSPGFHWEAPDLVVRRQQDGTTNFVNQDLLRDGVTDHYVYGRVTNNGPNPATNIRLSVVVGNYPSLQGLPGTEFRYPQDWYAKDWSTAAIQARHLALGESSPTTLAVNATAIIGPVKWPASQIPDPNAWHPCLLAEVRADNNDSAGGTYGAPVDADPDPCMFGSYFWGNNNVCQRNLSYAPIVIDIEKLKMIELPFVIGSPWSKAKFVEIVVEKAHELRQTQMKLRKLEKIHPREPGVEITKHREEIVLLERSRVALRLNDQQVGELLVAPGTVWQPTQSIATEARSTVLGGERISEREWTLTAARAAVGFEVARGEMHCMSLSFIAPPGLPLERHPLIQIFQRNDRRVITGSVLLELVPVKRGKPDIEVRVHAEPERAAKPRLQPVKK